MPHGASADDGGQIDPAGETVAMLFIGQEIDRQREIALEKNRDQTVLSESTDQAVEGEGVSNLLILLSEGEAKLIAIHE
jgi:hypothetical protein